jgi:hypothetical protein
MKHLKPILLALASIFLLQFSSGAQAIYNFRYRLSDMDTTTYDAFVVISGAGGGFARVKYFSPDQKRNIIVETQLVDTFTRSDDGLIDESRIGYATLEPKLLNGQAVSMPQVVFWFKANENDVMEPWVVVPQNATTEQPPRFYDHARMMEQTDLKRDFVLQYFTRKDSVFLRMFEGVTRGEAPNTRNMTMHMIVVADVNDDSIGPSAAKDKDAMLKMLNSLAGSMKVNTNEIVIAGDNYSKKALLNALSNLKPGKQDMIIFYYTGHGFRKSKTTSARHPLGDIYPHLDLRGNKKMDHLKESLGIDSIYSILVGKGARFNLILSDCCNSVVEATNTVARPPAPPRGPEYEKNMGNVQALFLNPEPVSIIATAANVQELASSNNNFGGFFSYFFRATLNFYLSSLRRDTPTWEALLRDAKAQTIKKASNTYCSKPYIDANLCKQFPVFNVFD